jgi:hypothetical protein
MAQANMGERSSTVVTRLDRVIQYPGELQLKYEGSAILDRPVLMSDCA